MPANNIFVQSTNVLLSEAIGVDDLRKLLAGHSIRSNTEYEEGEWQVMGPGVVLDYQLDEPGSVFVDIVDRPWPDEMSADDASTFSAWSVGCFGPQAFPGNFSRACAFSWLMDDAEEASRKHSAFVRVRLSYMMDGPKPRCTHQPKRSLAEVHHLSSVALDLLQHPAAICYFNNNGEMLLHKERLHEAISDSPPGWESDAVDIAKLIQSAANLRMYEYTDGWWIADSIGMEQFGLPDLEFCMSSDKGFNMEEWGPMMMSLFLAIGRKNLSYGNGDVIHTHAPSQQDWRCLVPEEPLIGPARDIWRWLPVKGPRPPRELLPRRPWWKLWH